MGDIKITTVEHNNIKLYMAAIQVTIDSYRPKKSRCKYKIHARLGTRMPRNELGECRYYDLKNGIMSMKIKCAWGQDFIDNLSILVHESIHAAQYITHTNVITDDGEFFWNGKSYGYINYDNIDSDEQYALPWEKEAYDLENYMIEKFVKYYISEVRIR